MDALRSMDAGSSLVGATSRTTQQALDIGRILSTDVTVSTVFPNTTLGNQLLQVAKVIKFNATSSALGLNRQIFFCQLGGFDTHQNQLTTQANLLTQLGQAMRAFYDASVELGLDRQITAFTLLDFSRTLQPAGSGGGVGTDHAWGNHHIVVGGAISRSSSPISGVSARATLDSWPERRYRVVENLRCGAGTPEERACDEGDMSPCHADSCRTDRRDLKS